VFYALFHTAVIIVVLGEGKMWNIDEEYLFFVGLWLGLGLVYFILQLGGSVLTLALTLTLTLSIPPFSTSPKSYGQTRMI